MKVKKSILLIMLCAIYCSCSSESKIEGKWKKYDGGVFEFKNGSIIYSNNFVWASYSFIDNERIKFKRSSDERAVVMKIKYQDNKLILMRGQNKFLTLERVE